MSIPALYHFPNETNDFTLPSFGSQESIIYYTSLMLEDGKNLFFTASNNIPLVDINTVINQCPSNEPFEQRCPMLKQQLAFNRLSNRICEACGDKSDIRKLSICTDCCLSWYCSKECQVRHWSTHKQRCCNINGPLDNGYQQIAILKIDEN